MVEKKRRHLIVTGVVLLSFAAVGTALCFTVDHIVNGGMLMRIINSNTKVVHVNYESCSGSMLGRFHFKELEVDSEDSMVKWQIHIKDAIISPSIWRLPLKEFYTGVLLATGFTYHLEFKPKKAGPDDINGYRNNWRLKFGKIDLEQIHEITIGKLSYHGSGGASLQSGFYFWPEYELQVEPSRFQAPEAEFAADFKFQLGHVRFREAPGLAFFRTLSAELKFSGIDKDFSFLNYHLRSVPWIKLGGDGARLNAAITVVKGIVDPVSKFKLDVPNLIFTVHKLTATGSGTVTFDRSNLRLALRDYRLQPLGIGGKSLDFAAVAKKVDLADPLADLELNFDLSPTRIDTAVVLNRYLTNFKTAKITKGSAVVAAKLRMSSATSKVSGVVEATAKGLELTAAGNTIKTDAHLLAKLADSVSVVGLDLSHFTLSGEAHQGATQVDNWWGKLVVSDAHLSLGQKNDFTGTAHLTGRDGKPFLLALLNSGALPVDFTTVTSMRDLSAESEIHVDEQATRINDFRLHSTTLQARGHFEFKDGRKFGQLKIRHPLHNFEVDFK